MVKWLGALSESADKHGFKFPLDQPKTEKLSIITHCILVGSSTVTCWTSLYIWHFRGVRYSLSLLFYF